LENYAGQPIFLAFRYQGVDDADMWYLDDVQVTTDMILSSDSPTPLGRTTTMTASVAPGRDASFAWDFGDSNFGSGAVVTHTYAAAGTYTVVVTASNSLTPTLTRSMQVTVQRQIYLPLVLRH
jgi:spore coat protein U-like protein